MAIPPDGRFDLDTVNVIIGTTPLPVFVEYDYTHPDVAATYANYIQVIYDIFNRTQTSPAVNNENLITQADADAVRDALLGLTQLAQNGLIRNNTDTTTKTFFLTKEMASNLDLLIRSFKAVGAADPTVALTDAQLEKWKDISVVSPTIQNIMQLAIAAIPTNRSLQALIELEYVRTGNELIEEKFSSLEDALTITNDLLDALSRLQDIRNRQVIVQPPTQSALPPVLGGGDGNFSGVASAGAFEGDYRDVADQFFGQPVSPTLPSTLVFYGTGGSIIGLTNIGVSVFNNLIRIKHSLQNFVSRLSAIATPEVIADPNSLYNRVKTLVADYDAAFRDTSGPFETFIGVGGTASTFAQGLAAFLLDNQNTRYSNVTGRTAGDSQSNLTFTITAAQGLNDQQKEEVRRFLFVFEEFYKSAAAMLQRITQILEKMAQNISR